MKQDKLNFYLNEAKRIHNNKYSYEKTNPKTCKTDCIVTCPIHGDFVTNLDRHVNAKRGCPYCSGNKKSTTEDFITKAKKVHGDRYDYSKVDYKNCKTDVIITCPIHGDFKQRPSHHLSGHGCPLCHGGKQRTTEDFIKKARLKHGDKYDYSKVDYKNYEDNVTIICPIHGEFKQQPSIHLQGNGCPYCGGTKKLTTAEFIKKAREVHGDRYDYSKVDYKNAKTEVIIICPRHGEFKQQPYLHTIGYNCPKCKSSKLESILINIFDKEHIEYIFQYRLNELGLKSIDFYLPKYNIAIECQGEQHYIPINFSQNNSYDENKEFEKRLELDKLKYDSCIKNKIDLVYFTNPKYFHDKTININIPFYKDKKVFLEQKELIDFLKSIKKIENKDSKIDFLTTLSNINRNIIAYNDYVEYNGKRFYYVYLKDSKKEYLKDLRLYNNKHDNESYFVYEDEWKLNPLIVINKIKHICHIPSNETKIMARKTKICEIDNKLAKDFLDKNHIQGFASASIYLGSFYNDNLIAVMCFKKESKEGFFELNRFASDNSCICQGIGGKLFSHFIKHYNPYFIKSFADKRWTYNEYDNLYVKLNFKRDCVVRQDYYYAEPNSNIRMHKFGFRKEKLNKLYGLSKDLTEDEMIKKLGLIKVWNLGLIKYIWKKD